MENTFKTIAGYPKYKIDTSGNVYSSRSKLILKHQISTAGYPQVLLYNEKGAKRYSVHRLVMETHNPHPNQRKLEVDHIFNDKMDCRLCSLRWLTPAENTQAAILSGARKGKITFEQIVDIRNADASVTNKELANKYKVLPESIRLIRKGISYKYFNAVPKFSDTATSFLEFNLQAAA